MVRGILVMAVLLAGVGGNASACMADRALVLPSSIPVPEWQSFVTPQIACINLQSFIAKSVVDARRRADVVAPAQTGAAYIPKTKDDNTPWRFDMNQNGKRMTADEFDAWMKAKGIRVATGKPVGETAAPAAAPAPACIAGPTTTC